MPSAYNGRGLNGGCNGASDGPELLAWRARTVLAGGHGGRKDICGENRNQIEPRRDLESDCRRSERRRE